MCEGQRVGDFAHHSASLADTQPSLLVQLQREVLSIDERHHEEHEVLHLVDTVDRNDVRVAELCRRLRLAKKARANVRAERELRWEKLDRHGALETAIARTVNDAHASTAELILDLVVRAEDARHMRA
jgi:hypothetical protein